MIISVSDLRQRIDCGEASDEAIEVQLRAIEATIRAYTNNTFQIRAARFAGPSQDHVVTGAPVYMAAGDTVQISQSNVNDGLYMIEAVTKDGVQVDRKLWPVAHNLVTKVSYPPDVIQCAVDLYNWKQINGSKIGIKSETLSRHSTTYEDSATLYNGYPVGILNGLALYQKARF